MKEWFWFFHEFRKLSENYSASLTKFLGKIVKIPLYVIIGSFWVETVCWWRSIIFLFLNNELINFGLLAESLWRGCKCTIHVYRNHWSIWKNWQNALEKSFFFYQLWALSKKLSSLEKKICQQGYENWLVLNFGNNLMRNEFSLKIVIFLSFPTLTDYLVGAVVKTEIYVSIRTLSVDFFREEFSFVTSILDIERTIFGPCDKNFSAGLSKLHCGWS